MQPNYEAWNIDVNAFPRGGTLTDQLRFLIGFAVLAPSSHNSQPWKFKVAGDHIQLCSDLTRALPKSDTNHRQLYISLGCALENLLTAADYYGFSPSVQLLPDGEEGSVAARLEFSNARREADQSHEHLVFAILKRYVNRGKYRDQMPDGKFLDWMRSLGSEEMRIDIINEPAARAQIADITLRAGIAAMDDPGFREEISQYVVSNISGKHTGIPGFTLGLPTPVSLIAPFLLKHFNMNRVNQKQDEALLEHFTPAFVVMSASKDDRETWIKTGQLFERIMLEAVKYGLSISPMAAAIQIGNFYKELQKVLGRQERPQVFNRLGYCDDQVRHSPRLRSTDVIAQ